uniref:Ycf36 n=1 Tax=Halydictyon mirabile TaxID=189652 RepID=A0A4D6WTB2_9FLOR|nr:hypothetical protein [Halydictyon mirabile]
MSTPFFKNSCPVPFNQQPLNEYLELKKSFFFSWSICDTSRYLRVLLQIFFLLWFICGLIIFYLQQNQLNILKIFILDFLFIDIVFILILMRLYLGWSYISNRLLSATIFYEESGWYDGQIWIKTMENLTRDRLVGLYQLMPCLNRIKYTFYVFFINFFLHYYLYCSF